MRSLFQAGTLISMLQGIYEGDFNFAKLSQYGDTGLGTIDGVDGEMIAFDGKFYRIDADGKASIIQPNVCTPFAVVSEFEPEIKFTLENISDFKSLEKILDEHITNYNIFYMLRIEAELIWAKVRSEACQMKPYRPLGETMPALQTTYELHQTTGTIIATRCPVYAATVNVPGYHFHYIDQEKKTGGHIFDLEIKSARVMIQPLYALTIKLFHTDEFAKAKLDVDVASATHQVEKSPQS